VFRWERLRSLSYERRNQSQEVKTMYATFQSMEGVVAAGIAGLEKHEFTDMDELKDTIADVQVTFTTKTCTSLILELDEDCIL